MLSKGLLIVVSAPSGTGKTTLSHMLLSNFPNLSYSVSYTTRPMRVNEINGKDYFFVSKDTFQKMIDENDFLEWIKVFNHYYGTSKSQVESELSKGKDILLDIDVKGALNVKRLFPEAVLIFLMPPSFKALKQRLIKRQTSEDEISLRLKRAKSEISYALKYDYIVVNDKIKLAFERLKSIIIAERCSVSRLKKHIKALRIDSEILRILKEER